MQIGVVTDTVSVAVLPFRGIVREDIIPVDEPISIGVRWRIGAATRGINGTPVAVSGQ